MIRINGRVIRPNCWINGVEMRLCGKCKIVKPVSDFYKNKKFRSGYTQWCKECDAKYQKERRNMSTSKFEKLTGISEDKYHKLQAQFGIKIKSGGK